MGLNWGFLRQNIGGPYTLEHVFWKIQEKPEEGFTFGWVDTQIPLSGAWQDDGDPDIQTTEIDVTSSVCADCKAYVVSCTVKREVKGTARININRIGESKVFPGNIFGHLIRELNQSTEWEEAAHLAAAKRWLKDHQKTGCAFGCNEISAWSEACAMADRFAQLFEAASMAAYQAENVMIDEIGLQWKRHILEEIKELKMDLMQNQQEMQE